MLREEGMRQVGSFEILEHTADVGIRAQGGSLEELFEQATRGLAVIVGIWAPASDPGRPDDVHSEQMPIELEARDLGALLVDWLGEIVYLSDVTTGVLTRVQAEKVRVRHSSPSGGCRATGTLWLGPGADADVEGTAVKAITYHRLKVAPTPAGWMAEVYVDV